MANIKPFKGLMYNTKKVNISDVVSLPYDKLDRELLKKYESKSEYNIARLIAGDYLREDKSENWYYKVKNEIERWIENKILIYSSKPSIYVYIQEFNINNSRYRRLAYISLGELQPFDKGRIKPHENTFSGPKKDRSKLLEITGINFGHIFMLYFGKENNIRESLEKWCEKNYPLVDFIDEFDIRHIFWEVSDDELILKIKKQMENQKLLIADGHHRYESALELYLKKKKEDPQIAEKYKFRMMAFVDLNDPALVILPTHRVFLPKRLLREKDVIGMLSEYFDVEQIEYDIQNSTRKLEKQRFDYPFFIMVTRKKVYFLKFKNSLYSNLRGGVEKLAVSVLQNYIAGKIFGLDSNRMIPDKDVFYFKDCKDVFEKVRENGNLYGFLLNPTPIDHLKMVIEKNERMPQKSTDFYPKIYTGFVFNKIV